MCAFCAQCEYFVFKIDKQARRVTWRTYIKTYINVHTSACCVRCFYRYLFSQFPLLYSYPCFPVSFYLFYVSSRSLDFWIFITSGGRIQDEIYDVLLANPSREVAWRTIVYLRMHTRYWPTKKKYIFRNSMMNLGDRTYFITKRKTRVREFPYK